MAINIFHRMVTAKRERFRLISWCHGPAHFLLCISLLNLHPVQGAESSRTSNPGTNFTSPLEPRQTLSHFQLEPGLRVELVAAEPLVVAPVAIAFDERGRLFVAENRGYPTGPGPDKPPAGQIALLEDRDRDGYFETRTTFADQLTYPNGLMPWKGGLLVTCAPDLLFLQDTNRDGRCDQRTVLFTGFATNGSTQLRVGYPTLSPEGWIYLASGLSGGKIVSPLHPGMPAVDIGGGDFRFRPDFGKFEMVDGKAQFGLAIDEYAERFITMNRVHIKHVVLPSRYLRRNPHLLFSETVQNVPESMVPEPLKGHLAAARIYPISENVTTADSHAGTFTAACGLLLYRGTALPPKYRGQAFTCDPTGNLIHWDQLLPNGPTFLARRAEEKKEFMATADGWFRPVFLANGPDGALYVCDMYRKTIEHPQYLPDEIRKRTDFESGKDRGRIYRVVAENFRSDKRKPAGSLPMQKDGPALEEKRGALVPALARNLDHVNGWHRDTTFRLLLELGPASTPRVKREAEGIFSSPRSLPAAQALALQLLQEKGALDDALLLKGFHRSDPSVRKVAIELAESRLKNQATADQWLEPLTRLANDPSAAVRFQSALALGELDTDQKIKPLAKIALTDAKERWTRAAVLSGVNGKSQAFLRELIEQVASIPGSKKEETDLLPVFNDSARLVSAENPKQFAESLEMILAPAGEENQSWQIAAVNGLFEGLKPDSAQATEKLLKDDPRAARLPDLLKAARRIVEGAGKSELRIASISLLGVAGSEQDGAVLLELLQTKESVPVQSAVIRALLRRPVSQPIESILEADRWSRLTPAVKELFLQGVIANNRHLPVLLNAIENRILNASVLDAARRNQLKKHPNTEVRTRAEKLFENSAGSDRMKVYDEYKSVLELKTQPGRGREMFKLHCASCHRLDREGIEVGPDLFAIRNQPKEAILLHVLIPEHEIVPGFTGYVIETKAGETLNGLIASETPTSITIKQPLGIEKTISRSEVISLNSIGSLMPQEMEKNMTRQEMADLIAYLKGE